MTYKPERKYIVEMKDVTANQVYGRGGYWFSNSSSGTASGSETIGSFEILRNDFAINTSSSTAGKWYIPEAGRFKIKVQAIMIVNQTPEADDIFIRGYNGTNNPYTPSRIHNVGTGGDIEYFRNDHTYTMGYDPDGTGAVLTDFYSLKHEWIQESTGGEGGNMFLQAVGPSPFTALVEEFLYQRIEITKL